MSTAPIVSWTTKDGEPLSSWSIGQIDAGSQSGLKNILIWNNKGGVTDVAHMQDCKITTVDTSGGEIADAVLEKWTYVRCDSMGETGPTQFTQIGGEEGNDLYPKTKKTVGINADPEDGLGIIRGNSNNGDVTSDKNNYAEITTYFQSKLHGVTAGVRNYSLRIEYFYV